MKGDTFRLNVTLIYGCFSCFLNCTEGTKLYKASHFKIAINIRDTLNVNKLP